MRQQIAAPSSGALVPRMGEWSLALGHGLRRGVIRAAAITTMLVIYAAASIGSIGSSALGVAGISSVALLGTTAPANAWRRRRRRRWHPRFYYGYGDWRWRRRRRRRRRHGFSIYLRF
jgi:hypothetical protein